MAAMFLENPLLDFNVLNSIEQAKVGMTYIYDGRVQVLTEMVKKNKLRGIKIVDKSKQTVPDSDSSNDEADDRKIIIDDFNALTNKVQDLIDKQQEQASRISPKWILILEKEGIVDLNGRVIDQERLDIIRKNIQLSMLQYADDGNINCLHIACKYGLFEMVKKIVEVSRELSQYYNAQQKNDFNTQFEKSGYLEK